MPKDETAHTLKALLDLLRDQMKDQALWAQTHHASEAYMQLALQKLHTIAIQHLEALLVAIDRQLDEAWQSMSAHERKTAMNTPGNLFKIMLETQKEIVGTPEGEAVGKKVIAVLELKRVQRVFGEYGQHKRKCKWHHANGVCNCGFAETAHSVTTGVWNDGI